jgi:hypothetical protein
MHGQNGFAAGCEDVAMPFRTIGPFLLGLCLSDSVESLRSLGLFSVVSWIVAFFKTWRCQQMFD